QLMDPAVDADLVSLGDDAALLIGMNERRHGRDVERRLDAVALEQLQDARHPDAIAVLPPGEPADRLAAVAQLIRLMVAVKGQRDRAARAARPARRAQRPPGAHPRHQLAPMLFRPLPGFAIGLGGVGGAHGLSCDDAGPREMVGAVRFELTTLSTP